MLASCTSNSLDEKAIIALQSDPELREIMTACAVSTQVTAKTLFPDRFFAEFAPEIHGKIFDLIDSGHPKVCIAAPRGFGKTSIVALALAARKILFQTARFFVYVSNSFDNAQLQTENLKAELVSNRMVRAFFGSVKAKRNADLDESFSKKAWVASSGSGGGTLVFPRGSGQQVRGLLYHNDRPDLIVIDDLEDPETLDSEDIRRKRKEWFFADLLKATSRMKKDWQIVYIDTLKHHDALLEHLLQDPTWATVRLEACDDNLKSNAPSFMSDKEVREEWEAHKSQGLLDVFAREFRNRPIAAEDAVFQPTYFKYYDEATLDGRFRMETFILVDPAKTVKLHSADSAVVAVGIDSAAAAIYVRDIFAEKVHPDELYQQIFMMAEKFNTRIIGIEVTSLNEFITQPLKQEMHTRGKFYEIVELNPRGGSKVATSKADRIAAMVPYYRQGRVYHNPACSHKLEMQLIEFPRPKKWDVMDCLAYFVQMLDRGERWFEPPDEDLDSDDIALSALYDEMEEPRKWQRPI